MSPHETSFSTPQPGYPHNNQRLSPLQSLEILKSPGGVHEGAGHRPPLQNLLFNIYFIQMPDIIYIFLDRSVRSELTGACSIHHSHTCPAFFVLVCFFHFLLCSCIGTEITKDKVLVCSFSTILVQERVVKITEQFCIAGECSVYQFCQYLTDLIICIVDDSWIISTIVFVVDNFVCAETKDKGILLSYFFYDLYVQKHLLLQRSSLH